MSKYREKAAALAAQMNLEEKVGQTLYTAPAVERLGIVSYNWWNEALHGVARAGTATVFPQAIGMAATFDEELLKQVGDVIATEARAKYNAQQRSDCKIRRSHIYYLHLVLHSAGAWHRGNYNSNLPIGFCIAFQAALYCPYSSSRYEKSTFRW